MIALREVGTPRIINLGELAEMLDFSTNTLRSLIRNNKDFPIEAEGDHGVAYRFDADQVVSWWQSHAEQIAVAKSERQAELDQMRLDLFGGDAAPVETQGMTARERRAEIEAQLAADKLRRQRGELLVKADVDNLLRSAFSNLAKGLRQIPVDIAREHALDRSVRVKLEATIRKHVNATVDRIQQQLQSELENG